MIHRASPPLVDEWPTCLNRSMEETLLALDGEKMYVGSSHREQRAGRDCLYRHSIQGEGGLHAQHSRSEADIRHLQYWDACIEPGFHKRLGSAMEESGHKNQHGSFF